jgi:hypothetical protein
MSVNENELTFRLFSMTKAATERDGTAARALPIDRQSNVRMTDESARRMDDEDEDDEAGKVSEELADYYVDELQALNTALCFLCSINADAEQVDTFLKLHPEALLLEGTCMLPEDSAVFILRQQMRRCKCQGLCSLNRIRVLALLNSGFEKYQPMRVARDEASAKAWNFYFARLVQMEHEIRRLRRDELTMRNTLVETAFELRSYRDELKESYRVAEEELAHHNKVSPLKILVCAARHHVKDIELNHHGSRRNVLEYQVGVASINLKSVEREHAALLHRIREGRRTQFGILKRAFQGCRRHEICSVKKAPSESTTVQISAAVAKHLSTEGPPSAQSTSGSSSN